jgi:hypothetical protein
MRCCAGDAGASALQWNPGNEASYRRFGAVIIDGTRPPEEVTDAILAAATTADGAE